MFNPPHSQAEIAGRVNEVLAQWHDADVSRQVESYRAQYSAYAPKHSHVGAKYIRLDIGTSGAFMAEIESGIIYGIKGYGVPNKKKISGNIWDTDFNGATLTSTRFKYGNFDLRKVTA